MTAEDVLVIIVAVLLCWGGWRMSLRLHPYAPCRHCRGRRGRNWGSTPSAWGNCSACGGSGRRLRWGARQP